MKKSDLVNIVRNTSGLNTEASSKVVNAVIDSILGALAKSEPVSLVGFGTFEAVHKPERTTRNPQSGSPTTIPEHMHPKFKFAESVRLAFRDGQQSKYLKNEEEA